VSTVIASSHSLKLIAEATFPNEICHIPFVRVLDPRWDDDRYWRILVLACTVPGGKCLPKIEDNDELWNLRIDIAF
jgi:hypothetical protein